MRMREAQDVLSRASGKFLVFGFFFTLLTFFIGLHQEKPNLLI